MKGKNVLALYDFDGTITLTDTFVDIIRQSFGLRGLAAGFLRYSPKIIAMKLKLYPNWKAKEKIFSHFFAGMDIIDFDRLCQSYFEKRKGAILRKDAIESIRKHIEAGHEVAIVSASIENWILPFAKYLGIKTVIATKAETFGNRLTGKFGSNNCHGKEKVERIKSAFPTRENYTIFAYGDSSGDKQMLEYANKAFYRTF